MDFVREIDRRRREDLRRSLQNPHRESAQFTDEGLEAWTRGLPEDDPEALVDRSAGKPIGWVSGEGWLEGDE